MQSDLLRTSLYEAHVALGARMAPFGGWLMPIQYAGVVAEHLHTRASAGLFDLSHMGRIRVEGQDARALVQAATSNDVDRLQAGRVQYSLMCNSDGGIVEDLLVYRLRDEWQLVVNAVNRTRVLHDLLTLRQSMRLDATLQDRTFETALIGLQGPAAERVLQAHVSQDLTALGYYRAEPCSLELRGVNGLQSILLSRTGYTGEDGFEIQVDATAATAVWNLLVEHADVEAVGLGARDTLRLEAGMCLYGHEISEGITPFEAGLARVVRLDKDWFVGRDALLALSQATPSRRLVGLSFGPGAVPRAGCVASKDGSPVGEVCSGTFSPSLRCPIATALVNADLAQVGFRVDVIIRDAAVPAHIVSLPFVPHRTRAPGAVAAEGGPGKQHTK